MSSQTILQTTSTFSS